MRVAFVGKGGAGKSTIAATYARLLARQGREVLAVDSDPMPGLCFGLGLEIGDGPIPDDAVEEKAPGEEGPRFRLRPGLDAWTAVQTYAARGGDGVRFLSFEKSRGDWGRSARSQHAWSQIVAELPVGGFDLVGDLPGGTRQPMTGWGRYADVIMVVTEPTAASMGTARRLANLRTSKWAFTDVVAVANRVANASDVDEIARRTGLTVIAAVPLDHAIARADRLGHAPLDAAPGCEFVAAVASLVTTTLERYDAASTRIAEPSTKESVA